MNNRQFIRKKFQDMNNFDKEWIFYLVVVTKSYVKKALVEAYFDRIVLNGDYTKIDDIIHPNYTRDEATAPSAYGLDVQAGREAYKSRIKKWSESFKVNKIIKEVISEEDDKSIMVIATVTITQIENWFHRACKDKTAVTTIFCTFQIQDDKIISIRSEFDYLKFWSDLGHATTFRAEGSKFLTQVTTL